MNTAPETLLGLYVAVFVVIPVIILFVAYRYYQLTIEAIEANKNTSPANTETIIHAAIGQQQEFLRNLEFLAMGFEISQEATKTAKSGNTNTSLKMFINEIKKYNSYAKATASK